MTSLQSFSDIVAKMGDERRAKEDAAYEQAVAEREETECSIAALSNSDLLAFIVAWRGTSDPRMTLLNSELRDYAMKEALRRMDGVNGSE